MPNSSHKSFFECKCAVLTALVRAPSLENCGCKTKDLLVSNVIFCDHSMGLD